MLSLTGAAGVGLAFGWLAALLTKTSKKTIFAAFLVAVASVSLTLTFLGSFHAAITGACWTVSYLLHSGWRIALATRHGGQDV